MRKKRASEPALENKNPAAVALGRLGGMAKTTKPKGLAALSKLRRHEIAVAAVAARRTMPHYVYLAESENQEFMKIGLSINPKKRMGSLRMSGFEILGKMLHWRLLAQIPGDAAAETVLFAKFSDLKINSRSEEFYRHSRIIAEYFFPAS